MTTWEKLVERYADGRPICNCRQAYLTPCGRGSVMENGAWANKEDMLACAGGCSSNQIQAREDVARRALDELAGKEGK